MKKITLTRGYLFGRGSYLAEGAYSVIYGILEYFNKWYGPYTFGQALLSYLSSKI